MSHVHFQDWERMWPCSVWVTSLPGSLPLPAPQVKDRECPASCGEQQYQRSTCPSEVFVPLGCVDQFEDQNPQQLLGCHSETRGTCVPVHPAKDRVWRPCVPCVSNTHPHPPPSSTLSSNIPFSSLTFTVTVTHRWSWTVKEVTEKQWSHLNWWKSQWGQSQIQKHSLSGRIKCKH